jgi:hypothetical protein
MAREIAETLVLRGKDAKRFREAMQMPKEEIEAQKQAYELAKQRATFYLP